MSDQFTESIEYQRKDGQNFRIEAQKVETADGLILLAPRLFQRVGMGWNPMRPQTTPRFPDSDTGADLLFDWAFKYLKDSA